MHKVVLVDDERYVVDSLKASVDWGAYGFEVVGDARNGILALDLIEKVHPDLVFTDIRMPGMDGLELIRQVSETTRDVMFVAVSGYAEFTYVQKAMNFGAVGYCLKPFDQKEIGSILKKVRDTLDDRRAFMMLDFMELMDETDPASWERIRSVLRKLKFHCEDRSRVALVVAVGEGLLLLDPNLSGVEIRLGRRKHLYLIGLDEGSPFQDWIIHRKPEGVLGLGYVLTEFTQEGIHDGIGRATLAAYQYFINGGAAAYDPDALDTSQGPVLVRQLEDAIDNRDDKGLLVGIEQLRAAAAENHITIQHALNAYNLVMSYMSRKEGDPQTDYLYRYEQLAAAFPDAGAMLDQLKSSLGKMKGARTAALPEDIRNEKFREILRFVNENFAQDISVQSLSAQYNFNPNYMSQLFKKVLKMTFTDYVTMLRISFAGNLLRTAPYSVSEIAERSGYDDYFYFTRVFKKTTGMTPTEYKTRSRETTYNADRPKNNGANP
jgi:two-component system response regulator YesN